MRFHVLGSQPLCCPSDGKGASQLALRKLQTEGGMNSTCLQAAPSLIGEADILSWGSMSGLTEKTQALPLGASL